MTLRADRPTDLDALPQYLREIARGTPLTAVEEVELAGAGRPEWVPKPGPPWCYSRLQRAFEPAVGLGERLVEIGFTGADSGTTAFS